MYSSFSQRHLLKYPFVTSHKYSTMHLTRYDLTIATTVVFCTFYYFTILQVIVKILLGGLKLVNSEVRIVQNRDSVHKLCLLTLKTIKYLPGVRRFSKTMLTSIDCYCSKIISTDYCAILQHT